MRRFSILALVAPMVVISACSTPSTPSPNVERSDGFVSYDDQLAQVAEEMTGFGGMFFDDQGVLNVYLAGHDLSTQAVPTEQLKDAITAVFGEDILMTPRREGSSLEAQATTADIKTLAGQYDIPTLLDVRRQADSLLALPGVVSTDLDEARNRVVIGVVDDAVVQNVEAEIKRLGVLDGTVIVERDEPVQPLVGLRDKIRPPRGGIQIERDEGFASYCTLGFNAIRNGVRGFVTNSHCTNTQGGVEGTIFYQDLDATDFGYDDASDYKIGVEIADPTYYRYYGLNACPWPTRCRYSDSAFVKYDRGISSLLARIARPASWGDGTLTIHATKPTLQIVSETHYPSVGQYLHKIGRSTGWTWGKVSKTCKNAKVKDSDIKFLCQTEVARDPGDTFKISYSGDSGSPVFTWNGVNTSLAGVLWGSSSNHTKFIFSPMPNIEYELGALSTTPTIGLAP